MTKTRHTLLHLDDGLKRAVDPKEVFLLEADGDDTLIRLWQSSALRDRRNLDEVLRTFEPFGFLRLHRSHAVNLDRIREVRLQADGRDWEIKLEPPVNRVLPVSRSELARLWQAFGEQDRTKS